MALDSSKIKGYLNLMKTANFVLYMAGYMDLLEIMSRVSLTFQRDNLPASAVKVSLVIAKNALAQMKERPGEHLTPVVKAVADAIAHDESAITYKDVIVKVSTSNSSFYERCMGQIVQSITSCFDDRLSTFVDNPSIQASEILDPKNLPMDPTSLLNYGEEAIDHLSQHFQPLLSSNHCDITQLHHEWAQLRDMLARYHRHDKFTDLWQSILRQEEEYPNLHHLVQILLLIPSSTAQVERQFSTIKRCQGDWRLSLKKSTIEDLLRIKTEGLSPQHFDPRTAVEHWWAECVRRSNTTPYGIRSARSREESAFSDRSNECDSNQNKIKSKIKIGRALVYALTRMGET